MQQYKWCACNLDRVGNPITTGSQERISIHTYQTPYETKPIRTSHWMSKATSNPIRMMWFQGVARCTIRCSQPSLQLLIRWPMAKGICSNTKANQNNPTGFSPQAAATSPCARWIKDRVNPHPGQSIPNLVCRVQVSGMTPKPGKETCRSGPVAITVAKSSIAVGRANQIQ